jgi:hypothetical protein
LILHKKYIIIIIENKEKELIIMMFDLLTEQDKRLINSYRNCYASSHKNTSCDIKTLLSPWNKAKSGYLSELFKDSLIVERPIEFKESVFELEKNMREIYKESRIWNFKNKIIEPYAAKDKDEEYDYWAKSRVQERFVRNLFSEYTLAENAINFIDTPFIDIELKSGTFRVQKGMKPMRVITKIANSFGIGITPDEDGVSDLEHFRRKHSLGLNQKLLKGTLCLSIHPLDYMTMSDNCEGWDSCMSWENDGEYKQGTVEMMNSPCVVVGYLASNSNKLQWWGCDDAESWNSKKWRSLFVVDKDFIINVRSYPYINDNLVKAAIAELAEMSGWGKQTAVPYEFLNNSKRRHSHEKSCIINNRDIVIDFTTQAMYNDFGDEHYIALNPKDTHDIYELNYCYSGLSQCMWCGTTDDSLVGLCNEDRSLLLCNQCANVKRCSHCGDRYDSDELYVTAEGYELCQYCYDERTGVDALTDDIYYDDNLMELYLSCNETECDTTVSEGRYIYSGHIGTELWHKYFNIDNAREDTKTNPWGGTRYIDYVLVSDCTQEGLELFGLYNEDDVKDYLGQNENN